jgi:hypothetical protein
MKIIYNYQGTTGEFLSSGTADESPLEPGVWLFPANSTDVPPLDQVQGKTQHFVDGAWEYRDIAVAVEPELDPYFTSYQYQRAMNYPAIGDQLDALFHAGVFPADMAAKIQAVKDQFPKE